MSVSSASEFQNLTAQDATLEIACGGYGTFGIQLSGTWTGTITFEGTVDHGTWQTVNVTKTNSTSPVTSATGNGVWTGPCAGLLAVRVRFSTFGSGTAYARLLIAGTGGGSGSGGGGGGGGGTSSDFGAAFPAAGTAAGFLGSTGNMEPVELEADGSIPVTVISGGGSNASVGPTGDPVPVEATFVGADDTTGVLEGLTLPVLDYNTTGGTQQQSVIGVGLPSATGTVAGGTPENPFSIAGNTAKDGSGTRLIPLLDADGHIQADVLSSALPTGAATEATLASLNGKVTAVNTGAVVVASSALPTGASTLAEQQTQTTALGTLLTSANFAAAFGTAGTADAQVMSVQGIASMTPVQVSQATASNLNATVVGTGTFAAQVTSVPVREQILGSAQTVINTATDIAAGAFSGAPAATFTNNDAAVPGALYAMAMGEFPDWAAAPVAGTVVELWGLLKDTDGTDDDTDAPSGSASGGAMYFGAWVMAAADALQRRTIPIALPGITSGGIGIDFYIKNGTAQNMNNDGGTSCVVKITPFTTRG